MGDWDLFSHEGAYARNSDPGPSHEAAQRVDVNKMEAAVMVALRANGPMTSNEISLATGIHQWTISPRMKPLEDKGLVERCGRKATINSNGRTSSQTLWRAKSQSGT